MNSNGAISNSDKLKDEDRVPIGVLGSTMFWSEYGDALVRSNNLQVAAVAEGAGGLNRDLTRRLGRPTSSSDLSALISERGIQGLIVGVSTDFESIYTALAAGISVLSVSQFLIAFEGFDLLAQAAELGGSFLLPAPHRRFQNPFQLVKEVVSDGSIGKVERIECQLPIRARPQNGNGNAAAFGFGSEHAATLDLCLWWLGDANRICADLGWEESIRDKHLGSIIVNHADAVSIHQFMHVGGPHNIERYVIEGAKGKLEVVQTAFGRSGGDCPFRLTLTERGRASRDFSGWLPNALSVQDTILEHFSACLRGSEKPSITLQEMRRTAECVAAAQLSSREHAKITLPVSRCATPQLPIARRLTLTP